MAINAGCRRVVAGFLPGVELLRHNVTVHTGRWIFAKIRKAFSIIKCKTTQPDKQSE